jgi:hypothetical protein
MDDAPTLEIAREEYDFDVAQQARHWSEEEQQLREVEGNDEED